MSSATNTGRFPVPLTVMVARFYAAKQQALMRQRSRNCCRCGTVFATETRALICPDCRRMAPKDQLNFRECQLVGMIYHEGLQNKEMAWRLTIAEGTVKTYLNRLYVKLKLAGRWELMVWARENPNKWNLEPRIKPGRGLLLDLTPEP